ERGLHARRGLRARLRRGEPAAVRLAAALDLACAIAGARHRYRLRAVGRDADAGRLRYPPGPGAADRVGRITEVAALGRLLRHRGRRGDGRGLRLVRGRLRRGRDVGARLGDGEVAEFAVALVGLHGRAGARGLGNDGQVLIRLRLLRREAGGGFLGDRVLAGE